MSLKKKKNTHTCNEQVPESLEELDKMGFWEDEGVQDMATAKKLFGKEPWPTQHSVPGAEPADERSREAISNSDSLLSHYEMRN